jgi:DNA-binding Lrp family transcriptional regulator
MSLDDLCAQVLAHLHANSAMRLDDVAAAIGRSREDVEAAAERLVGEGHIERRGDRLIPDAASHPTPGIYVATERTDAQPLEVDYDE